MSKGHVFLAQNSTADYVTQAYILALSIKHHNKEHNQTCIITNDTVPEEYRHAFDHVIDIPWSDSAKESLWKIENRWKIIHATPFKESLVYDTDMILLSSNDHWWKNLEYKDIALTKNVYDYKGRQISNDFYRKTFTQYKLPNVYTGIHYVKKTKPAFEFYKWLQVITENYKDFYNEFLPGAKQKFCSMDINASLALIFLDAYESHTSNTLSFTHMKPAIQGWSNTPATWKDAVAFNINNNKQLKVGNFLQTGIFHYTENDFITNEIVEILRSNYV